MLSKGCSLLHKYNVGRLWCDVLLCKCLEHCVYTVQALELKQQGNSLFKQGRLEEAARCYEEAIQLSVGTEVKDNFVATCHQNLAAVYDEMVRHETQIMCMCIRHATHIHVYIILFMFSRSKGIQILIKEYV